MGPIVGRGPAAAPDEAQGFDHGAVERPGMGLRPRGLPLHEKGTIDGVAPAIRLDLMAGAVGDAVELRHDGAGLGPALGVERLLPRVAAETFGDDHREAEGLHCGQDRGDRGDEPRMDAGERVSAHA